MRARSVGRRWRFVVAVCCLRRRFVCWGLWVGQRGVRRGGWSGLPEAGFATGGECSVLGQARGGFWA